MITDSLQKTGKVVRGWLGVGIQEITPDLAKAFKVKEQRGALVSDVNEQGPALKAGLQRGDVIVEFDGKDVQSIRRAYRWRTPSVPRQDQGDSRRTEKPDPRCERRLIRCLRADEPGSARSQRATQGHECVVGP